MGWRSSCHAHRNPGKKQVGKNWKNFIWPWSYDAVLAASIAGGLALARAERLVAARSWTVAAGSGKEKEKIRRSFQQLRLPSAVACDLVAVCMPGGFDKAVVIHTDAHLKATTQRSLKMMLGTLFGKTWQKMLPWVCQALPAFANMVPGWTHSSQTF